MAEVGTADIVDIAAHQVRMAEVGASQDKVPVAALERIEATGEFGRMDNQSDNVRPGWYAGDGFSGT